MSTSNVAWQTIGSALCTATRNTIVIIYTFDSSQAEGKQYTHVTIATSNYSSAIGGCYICGHSVNQNGDYGDTKKLVAGKVKIYRVRTSVIVGGTERRVSIPVSGNEATVINDTF